MEQTASFTGSQTSVSSSFPTDLQPVSLYPPVATASTGTIPLKERPLVSINDTELRARVQWSNLASEHFTVYFDRICYHEMEAASLANILEDTYRAVTALTHEGFRDRVPVYLCDLRSPSLLGRSTKTHFNIADRSIYIVRSVSDAAEAELIAMVVHSTRFGMYLRHYGITPGWAMLEDAFATFITERLAHNRISHPFFGAEPDVIAAYLKSQTFLPMLSYAWQSPMFSSELERKVVAGAFLLFLGNTTSDDTVVAFSKCDDDVTSHTFETYFGKSLESLETAWTAHLPKSLLSYTDAEKQEMIARWNNVMSRTHR